MPVFVRYDKDGAIHSLVALDELPEGLDFPWGDIGADEFADEVTLDDQTRALALHGVIELYRFDPEKKRLVRRRAKRPPDGE